MSDVMEPGRELDALVAEKFPELFDSFYLSTLPLTTAFSRMDCSGEWTREIVEALRRPGEDIFPEKSPSTDIAAAWEVVEKLWEQGIATRVETGNHVWWVDMNGGINRKAHQRQDTAPHAICLAALEVVEQK